ncbi:MAG: glutamate 5-kinase [Pseudomonadota bacterium]|jgi:glutamate 5-kinase
MELGRSRIVVSIDAQTALIPRQTTPNVLRILAVLEEIVPLMRARHEVVFVFGGDLELGANLLGLHSPLSLAESQAAAALGYYRILDILGRLLGEFGRAVAPVLVTGTDLSDRERGLNLRIALDELTARGVAPLVGRNFAASLAGLSPRSPLTSCSHYLAALVAAKAGADILLIVSEEVVSPPGQTPVSLAALRGSVTAGPNPSGPARLSSPLAAAASAAICGVHTIIVAPDERLSDYAALRGERGFHILAFDRDLSGSERSTSRATRGVITVGPLTRRRLLSERGDLLIGSIRSITGSFERGASVIIADERGNEFGRGLTRRSSDRLRLSAERLNGPQRASRADLETPVVVSAAEMVIFDEAA